ncbi:hypothetical protein TNCT_72551 [Trichonephila clavata]|uniref:Uncharacterized protein n=1 Tax=Trichonephila clavata TaxID=2740835 RepID=A0A8X6JFN3_TRICU|nr:hypothetical protein TNCT_72551 [Trichonephila clavata]
MLWKALLTLLTLFRSEPTDTPVKPIYPAEVLEPWGLKEWSPGNDGPWGPVTLQEKPKLEISPKSVLNHESLLGGWSRTLWFVLHILLKSAGKETMSDQADSISYIAEHIRLTLLIQVIRTQICLTDL